MIEAGTVFKLFTLSAAEFVFCLETSSGTQNKQYAFSHLHP